MCAQLAAGRLTILAVDCGRSMSSRTVCLCILVPCLTLQGLALGLVPMSTVHCWQTPHRALLCSRCSPARKGNLLDILLTYAVDS